jgi:hypothetical protein
MYLDANSNLSGAIVTTGYNVYTSVIGAPLYFYWYVNGENVTYSRPWEKSWSNYSSASVYWQNPFWQFLEGTGLYQGSVSTGSYVYGTENICVSGGPIANVQV